MIAKHFLMGNAVFVNQDVTNAVKDVAIINESLECCIDSRVVGRWEGLEYWGANCRRCVVAVTTPTATRH